MCLSDTHPPYRRCTLQLEGDGLASVRVHAVLRAGILEAAAVVFLLLDAVQHTLPEVTYIDREEGDVLLELRRKIAQVLLCRKG